MHSILDHPTSVLEPFQTLPVGGPVHGERMDGECICEEHCNGRVNGRVVLIKVLTYNNVTLGLVIFDLH